MSDEKHLTVADVLRDACERYGADGLCNEECGCGLDDFVPCGEAHPDCILAKRIPCPDPECGCREHYVPLAIPAPRPNKSTYDDGVYDGLQQAEYDLNCKYPWIDAPDGPGWWWIEWRSRREVVCVSSWDCNELYIDAIPIGRFQGARFQRVQPPREV
jgi:hypothetical protein